MKIKQKYDNSAYLMILPAYLIFSVFVLLPVFIVAYYSITNFNMYTKPELTGLSNYIALFKDKDFLTAVKNTLVYSVLTLFPQLAIGLFIAILLYRKSKLLPFFRISFYIPNIMSMVCISMIWLWIYDPTFGLLNILFKLFGFSIQSWLQDPKLSMLCIVIMSIWKNCGYSMVIFLSGLTGIPTSLYEAAALDGAGSFRKFVNITWPMLRPTLFFLLVTGLVSSFSVFEQVNIMTGGGPLKTTTTIVHQIYRRGFLEFKMGYASAMAMVLLAFSILITLVVFKYGSGHDTDVS